MKNKNKVFNCSISSSDRISVDAFTESVQISSYDYDRDIELSISLTPENALNFAREVLSHAFAAIGGVEK